MMDSLVRPMPILRPWLASSSSFFLPLKNTDIQQNICSCFKEFLVICSDSKHFLCIRNVFKTALCTNIPT
jgi:hypothetical protein